MDFSNLTWIPAANFSKNRNGVKPRLIVIHTAETPENEGRAKQVAAYFSSKKVQASAHYSIDDKMIIKSVLEADTAWAVDDWQLNLASISVEHCGSASQGLDGWKDIYSEAELNLSANLTAWISKRWNIPKIKITPEEILAGASGFCGHADITIAKKIAGGHTDPGKFFPWTHYMNLVNSIPN